MLVSASRRNELFQGTTAFGTCEIINKVRDREDAIARSPRRPLPASPQNRIRRIRDAVFHHGVDIRSMRDVVQRIRIENHEIGETAIFEFADMRAGFAAEKFRSIRRGALQYLHRA